MRPEQSPEEKINMLEIQLSIIKAEKDEFLEENIKLGEMIDMLKDQIMELQEKNKTLEIVYNNSIKVNKTLKQKLDALKSEHNFPGRKPLSSETVEKIIELRNKGYTYSKIAEVLSVSKASISRYLNNPVYKK